MLVRQLEGDECSNNIYIVVFRYRNRLEQDSVSFRVNRD